jgi:hypothetical protein
MSIKLRTLSVVPSVSDSIKEINSWRNSDLMIEPRDLSGRTTVTASSTPGLVSKTSVSASISMLYSGIQLGGFFSRMHRETNLLELDTDMTSLDWSTMSRLILKMRSFKFAWWSWRWLHGGRQLSVFKPVDLHGRYPQQGRRWGSPWFGTRRDARGHKRQDLCRFR